MKLPICPIPQTTIHRVSYAGVNASSPKRSAQLPSSKTEYAARFKLRPSGSRVQRLGKSGRAITCACAPRGPSERERFGGRNGDCALLGIATLLFSADTRGLFLEAWDLPPLSWKFKVRWNVAGESGLTGGTEGRWRKFFQRYSQGCERANWESNFWRNLRALWLEAGR